MSMSKPTSAGGRGPGADGSQHIARGLVRLMMAVDDAYTQVSRELGLTAQQAQLLCAAQRPAPVRDIAAFLRCDRSNVSHLVDRTAGRGLLQRRATDSDGRLKLVELSPDGQELVQRFVKTLGLRFETLLADWPQERRDEASTILHELAETLERARDTKSEPNPPPPAPDPFP